MQDDDVQSKKWDVGLPDVYALEKTTEGIEEQQPITAQEFMDKQAIYSYYSQVSSTVLCPG